MYRAFLLFFVVTVVVIVMIFFSLSFVYIIHTHMYKLTTSSNAWPIEAAPTYIFNNQIMILSFFSGRNICIIFSQPIFAFGHELLKLLFLVKLYLHVILCIILLIGQFKKFNFIFRSSFLLLLSSI